MKIGDKVKTEIIEGLWFVGIYSDDFPDSNNILIEGKKMTLIVPKCECVLANER